MLALRLPGAGFLAPIEKAFTPEGRAQRVLLLLGATALMCLGDLSLTLTYVTSTGMVETNPLARAVMDQGSPTGIVVWKLSTMALGFGILLWARRTKAAEVASWVCFLAMSALCVHWLSFTAAMSNVPSEYAAMAAADDPHWVSMTP